MKFEDVLPALRAGKKVRRASWTNTLDRDSIAPNTFGVASALADDWEVIEDAPVPEPKRVADYFCAVGEFMWDSGPPVRSYVQRTLEIGKQPVGAVLVPGSERTQEDGQ